MEDTLKEEEKVNSVETKSIVLTPKQREALLKINQEMSHYEMEIQKLGARNSELSDIIMEAHAIDVKNVAKAEANTDGTMITLTMK